MTAQLTILVVDDEQIARRRLLRLLRTMDDVVVVGEASDVETAVTAAQTLRPDLMLLDVQMPGGDGFSVIDRLGALSPLVVFVTAFDHHALQAFEVQAVDYVTKPVDIARLEAAVRRARATVAGQGREELVADLLATVEALRRSLRQSQSADQGQPRSFWVKNRGVHQRIGAESIDYIQAERDYVRLFAGGQSHLISESISAMESRLAPLGFLRIHRSTLVRRDTVVQMLQGRYGTMTLRLRDGTDLRVGRTYADDLRSALGL
ncbi:response regulator transcription factor [Agrobacterium sp. a22-2]|uniref:LytR/AlgR family response regulator transcription factor n=1 Tax=Agrobacterium sp. a22-2 TaxID=2283840 RepID=UPI0014452C9F|nr:LytTR family DNA-binding domain-containing protein [Agrobacterium sp. a22-2]NKN36056.1 response regulator transcription factor [Agrobacterium sp. a22-2]